MCVCACVRVCVCVCTHDCTMYHDGYEQDVECSVGNEEGDESSNRFTSHMKLQLQVLQHQDVGWLRDMAVHCLWGGWERWWGDQGLHVQWSTSLHTLTHCLYTTVNPNTPVNHSTHHISKYTSVHHSTPRHTVHLNLLTYVRISRVIVLCQCIANCMVQLTNTHYSCPMHSHTSTKLEEGNSTTSLFLSHTHTLTFLHINHRAPDEHLPLLADTEHIKVTVRHVSLQIQVTHCLVLTAETGERRRRGGRRGRGGRKGG